MNLIDDTEKLAAKKFHKNIDKIKKAKELKSMKIKLCLLLGLLLGRGLMWGDGELEPLYRAFHAWELDINLWHEACNTTSDFVRTSLRDGRYYDFGDANLIALYGFLENQSTFSALLKSEDPEIRQEVSKYTTWAKNLYRLAYEVALSLDSTLIYGSRSYLELLGDKDIPLLFQEEMFNDTNARVKNILMRNIDWGD